FLAVPFLGLGTLFVLGPVSSAFAAPTSSAAGHVYVLDNTTSGNAISAFNRAAAGPNELVQTSDSHFLYSLDRGVATLSAFQVQSDGSLVSVNLGSITLPSSLVGLATD